MDGPRKPRDGVGLPSTLHAQRSELTRRNIGTCASGARPYIAPRREEKGWDLASWQRLRDWFEREFRGERRRKQGLRRSSIREVTSPARADGASRVPRPRRRGASTCSAEGRSATRSDPQHSHRRTSRPGQAAWGWKPELLIALPSDASVNRRRQEEERRESIPRLRVTDVRGPRAAYRAVPGASAFS